MVGFGHRRLAQAVGACVLAAGVWAGSAGGAGPAAGTQASGIGASSQPAKDLVVVDAKTEDVIKGAMKYLAGKQSPNGSWSSANGEHPVAVTAYTIMAFLAAGQLPNEGEYGKNVASGTQYLMNCVRADGYITSEGAQAGRKQSNMYDHGIGTIAMAEVYGQTQDAKVREKLALAVKLIVSAQGREGGWRYTPRPNDSDISVTVLQLVALRAAKNSGLDVPQATLDKAVAYVKACRDEKSGGFCYQPRQGPGFARTAAAIYCLQVCGLYDDPMVKGGSEYLLKGGKRGNGQEWFTYGNFYAAPAQYMIGGETWANWYEHIKGLLLSKVQLAGDKSLAYWEPIEGGGQGVGPVYATAIYTTILAMPYHYIPLYQR